MVRPNAAYQNYYKCLTRSAYRLDCRLCEEGPFTAVRLQAHMCDRHGIQKKTTCVWYGCSFEAGATTVKQNVPHLDVCFRRYCNQFGTRPNRAGRLPRPRPPVPPLGLPSGSTDDCFDFRSVVDDMCGRERLPVPAFYDPFPESRQLFAKIANSRLPPNPFGSDAVYYVRKYVDGGSDFVWYHAMVRACAFDSMTAELACMPRDAFTFLPFWCLCDGSTNPKLRGTRLHHRHGMCVVAKSHVPQFLAAWRRVRSTEVESIRVKWNISIQNVYHLINTISYVSNPGNCRGLFGDPLNHAAGKISRHYHVHRPLFRHAALALCLTLPDGLQTYLERTCGRKSVDGWESLTKKKIGSTYRWTAKVGEVCDLRGCVIPFGDGWMVDRRADVEEVDGRVAFLYLPGGDAILMKRDDDDWNDREKQRASGNCFLDVLVDCDYVLNKSQQQMANCLDRFRVKLEERHAAEMEDLRTNLEEQNTSGDGFWKVNSLSELIRLRARNSELGNDVDRLNERVLADGEALRTMRENWSTDVRTLQRHKDGMRKLLFAVHEFNERLCGELARCRDRETESRVSNGALRAEVERFRDRETELRAANGGLQTCVTELRAEMERFRDRETELRAEVKRLNEEVIINLKQEIERMCNQIVESREVLREKDAELIRLNDVVIKLKDEEIESLKKEIEGLLFCKTKRKIVD